MANLTDVFIRRPVLAIVVNLAIVVAGLTALRSINVRQYPKLDSATVTVKTAYVGANADLVRGFITAPLERAIAAADGIDYIESQSAQGLSTINARLKLNFNAANALADIGARVNQVRADLPPEAELPAISVEPTDAQLGAFYMCFSSTVLQDNQVTDYLIRMVQPRLSAIEGIQRADVLGGRTYAIRAWLKPDRMAAYNISPSQVRQALQANNYLAAMGQTKGSLLQINLTVTTDLRSVEDFKKLVIRQEGDTLIRLEDIADVVLGADTYESDYRFSGEKSVFVGIWVLPNANALDVIERVHAELDSITRDLPSGMHATVVYDSTVYIRNAVREVASTLTETVALVIVVVFLFLGSLRSVLVPVVAIPVSLIGALVLMQAAGFTLNLLTLLAIVLAVGLVVDDAIVVVENVERHIQAGRSRLEAAFIGARELIGPVIAMTIALAAVYAPIGFQGGLTGSLFREFAFTLAGAVLISGIVALTLSPMMSSTLLSERAHAGWLSRTIDRGFAVVRNAYDRALGRALASRSAIYFAWLAFTAAIVPMYLLSPQELAPKEDQGVVFGSLEMPANATLEQITPYLKHVQAIYKKIPEYAGSFQVTFPASGFGGLILAPWEQRTRTAFAVQQQLNRELSTVAGVRARAILPSALPSASVFPVEFVITSTASHEALIGYAEKISQAAAKSGQFLFPPFPDVRIDEGKTDVVLDRDRVASMGLTMQQVAGDLSSMVSGKYVNRFNLEGHAYKVIPQVERSGRLSANQLEDVYISGPNGRVMPLSAVAKLQNGVQPRTLNRLQQLNSVKLSGLPTRSTAKALHALEVAAADILPRGYRYDYTGESRQLRQEEGKFLPAIGIALVVIFLVLAAQFNSFRDPFVLLAGSVPLGLFGALVFTFLKSSNSPGAAPSFTDSWTTTLNIYSQVGLVTLVGLVAKNGIMIVEFANKQQALGMDKIAAVRHAATTRLRPILMTSVATVCGHFPLTLATGPGAVARNSIGIVLVGGMTIGTLLTLFVIPAVYVLFAKERHARPAANDFDDRDSRESHSYVRTHPGTTASEHSSPSAPAAWRR